MTPVESTFYLQAAGQMLRARTIIPAGKSLQGAPALVFLHEGLGCIEMWRDFPEMLVKATNLPAFIYDRYGSGGSGPLQGARCGNPFIWEAEVALPDILTACGIEKPILIGHSDGGSIALHYAARYPESLVGVIVEAAHVFGEELTLNSIRKAVSAFETGELRKKLARYHGDRTDTMFHGWADIWLLPENLSWNMEAVLSRITCPMLIVQGEQDEYGTLAQVEAIVRGVSGRTKTLVIPDCAHSPHLQALETTLNGMVQFVESLL
ncbi:MAG: alpha/beta hydrolase [Desulfuromonadaceae bacterium]|nr:alpha/beta hydrolase [Desulfuromonadaceae bacterium]